MKPILNTARWHAVSVEASPVTESWVKTPVSLEFRRNLFEQEKHRVCSYVYRCLELYPQSGEDVRCWTFAGNPHAESE